MVALDSLSALILATSIEQVATLVINNKISYQVSWPMSKLDSLQQKQLQGDIDKGINTLKKSRFKSFDHINMEIVLVFCNSKMFPFNKFLEPSILIFISSNKQSLCDKLSGLIEKPRESITPVDHEFYWSNNIVPMINKKCVEKRSNFNTKVKRLNIS